MTYALMDDETGVLDPTGLAQAPDPLPEGKSAIVEMRAPYFWDVDKRAYALVEMTLLTFNQWVDLFPIEEQVAIVTATRTDALAQLIYDRAMAASGSIDPADARTIEGIQYLVSNGWVSEETSARIIGTP